MVDNQEGILSRVHPMKSTLMLLAGAAALAFAGASAEPPHNPNCPPGHEHCMNGPQGGHDQMGRDQMGHDQMGHGPAAPAPKMMGGQMSGPGPAFKGGPADWAWQDDRGGWHRDHDRYWRPDFRAGFAPRDRLFMSLRAHSYNRFDGEPYWFRGRFVIRTFDRFGRPVIVELNPYNGNFIGVARF
jgi:hypothetical protein